jgi:hypothetical protein
MLGRKQGSSAATASMALRAEGEQRWYRSDEEEEKPPCPINSS